MRERDVRWVQDVAVVEPGREGVHRRWLMHCDLVVSEVPFPAVLVQPTVVYAFAKLGQLGRGADLHKKGGGSPKFAVTVRNAFASPQRPTKHSWPLIQTTEATFEAGLEPHFTQGYIRTCSPPWHVHPEEHCISMPQQYRPTAPGACTALESVTEEYLQVDTIDAVDVFNDFVQICAVGA